MGSCAPGLLEPPAKKSFSPGWSPLPGTTPHQPIPNLQMKTERNSPDKTIQQSMKSTDHDETRTIADLTPTGSPDRDTGIDLQDRTRSDGDGAPTADPVVRSGPRTKKRIA